MECSVAPFVIYEPSIVISLFHTFSSIPALIPIIYKEDLGKMQLCSLLYLDWFAHNRMVSVGKAANKQMTSRTQKQHWSAFIEMKTTCGEKPWLFFSNLCFLLFIRSAFPSLAPSVLSSFRSLSLSLCLTLFPCLDGWQRVAACCGQANYLHNYDLPLNHMILYLGVGN